MTLIGWITKEKVFRRTSTCVVLEKRRSTHPNSIDLRWMEAMIKQEMPPIENLAEELRNGIYCAYLAKSFKPDVVKRIFEVPDSFGNMLINCRIELDFNSDTRTISIISSLQ
jgi:hypothetical protein